MVRKERMLDDRKNKCRSSAARDGNFQKHQAGEGNKTRVDGRFFDQLSNHEDVDLDVLSKM